MPGFKSSRRFRCISATNSDRKSRFEYDLDRILAGGRSNRISLLSTWTGNLLWMCLSKHKYGIKTIGMVIHTTLTTVKVQYPNVRNINVRNINYAKIWTVWLAQFQTLRLGGNVQNPNENFRISDIRRA